jgi:4-carboxymuconolactone decarboxylase
MDIGSAVGRQKGISERQLAELDDFETSSAFREPERLVIRYALRMTETPVEVSDELFAQLRRHFDERQLVELTSVIAWENYRARFNHAVGLEAQGFSEGSFCALPVQSSMDGKRG